MADKTSENAAREDARRSRRRRRAPQGGKIFFTLLILALVCIMLFSGYQIVSQLLRYKESEDVYESVCEAYTTERTGGASDGLPVLTVDFAALKTLNSSVVGWLQGQGGTLNLPVVQGEDNDYYLTHLVDGTVNASGTLFADYRNRFLEDDVTYIYGHRMKNGTMFGSLKYYEDASYLAANPVFRLYTPDGTYTLRVYAVVYVDTSEVLPLNFVDEEDFSGYMDAYAERSVVTPTFSVSWGDKFVFLYTCSYDGVGRFLVICRLE